MILCSNPRAQYESYKDEIDSAVLNALDKGWYILGENVKAFEEEFSSYICVDYGIGVGSGTEALHLALKACDVGPGDEVITVSHTAVATVAAIELAGAIPVFVDINPKTYTMNPVKFREAITSKTKTVVPVHLYGHPANMRAISLVAEDHGLRVIEDCAHAHGAYLGNKKVGCFGNMACFSFYPTKNLGAFGDGGMVITDNKELADKARLLREYGWKDRYVSSVSGWNTRLDEVHAAVLRVKLKYLDQDNVSRMKIARQYTNMLDSTDLVLPYVDKGAIHVFHLYVIRCDDRDRLIEKLRAKDIGAAIHYPVPIHMQPAYKHFKGSRDLPETEKAATEILSLPIYPELSEEDVGFITETIKEAIER